MIEICFEGNRAAAYDGQIFVGECDFSENGNVWIADHTKVSEQYGGQGIAKKLLQCVAENAEKLGKKIRPVCSYVVREFEKNPGTYCDVKTYNFYGWEAADAAPASDGKNELFSKIKNPRHLYDLLNQIWCAQTCAPRMRDEWTEDNKTLGQCSITAFLAQDIFGGEVYGILRSGGNYHCYNVIGGCRFDLTSEQFGSEKLCYDGNPVQSREVHFAKEEKRLRYEFLKSELLKLLDVER